MKLVVYQGSTRRGNKPFCKSDFTLKWSALSWLFAGKDWKSCRGHSDRRDHQGGFQVWKVNNQMLNNASEWTFPLPSKQSQTVLEFQIPKRNGIKFCFVLFILGWHIYFLNAIAMLVVLFLLCSYLSIFNQWVIPWKTSILFLESPMH